MELPSYYQRLAKKVTMEEWKQLERFASVKYLRTGDAFLRMGKVAHHAAFVLSGEFKFSFVEEGGTGRLPRQLRELPEERAVGHQHHRN